jgi:hypothetical protein
VLASVLPENEEGYAIAHRTGIIGQVFRTRLPILATDLLHNHLYDPFDQTICWEFCCPIFKDDRLAAVINFEGDVELNLSPTTWRNFQGVIEQFGCNAPSSLPKANHIPLITTARIETPKSPAQALEHAHRIAQRGQTTLLVGHFPDLIGERGPTIAEARQQGLAVSYCYFGVDTRFDLLATGPNPRRVLDETPDWWNSANGRYDVVLIAA